MTYIPFKPKFENLRMTQAQFDELMKYLSDLEKVAQGNIAIIENSSYGYRWFSFVGDNQLLSEIALAVNNEKIATEKRKESERKNEQLIKRLAKLEEKLASRSIIEKIFGIRNK